MDREKRQLRKLKRDVKQAGNKKRRQKLKRDLRDNPHEAHLTEPSVGKLSSETLNGLDKDATRKRKSGEGVERN
jgi:hypothetical protein